MASKNVSFSEPAGASDAANGNSSSSPAADRPNELFHNIGSVDFLGFSFNGKSYDSQLKEAIQSTGRFCAVTAEIRSFAVRSCRPSARFVVSSCPTPRISAWIAFFQNKIDHRSLFYDLPTFIS